VHRRLEQPMKIGRETLCALNIRIADVNDFVHKVAECSPAWGNDFGNAGKNYTETSLPSGIKNTQVLTLAPSGYV
jgi:hypothetical protein